MDTIVVDGVMGEAPAAPRRRRSYSLEEKQRLVAESHEPGASVSVVARRHDINANLLFTWRRQMRRPAPVTEAMTLIPIEVVDAPDPRGVMEILLEGGVRVRVDAEVSEAALKRVLAALKAAA